MKLGVGDNEEKGKPSKQQYEQADVYVCPTCGYTMDAIKDIPASKLKCPKCTTLLLPAKKGTNKKILEDTPELKD